MTAKDFRDYTEAVNKASLLAQRDLAKVWERAKGLDPRDARNVLIALVPGIVYKYGQIAATAAAEYYETERSQAIVEPYRAELSAGVPPEQIKASVRFACGHMFPEDEDGIQPELDASLFGREG